MYLLLSIAAFVCLSRRLPLLADSSFEGKITEEEDKDRAGKFVMRKWVTT